MNKIKYVFLVFVLSASAISHAQTVHAQVGYGLLNSQCQDTMGGSYDPNTSTCNCGTGYTKDVFSGYCISEAQYEMEIQSIQQNNLCVSEDPNSSNYAGTNTCECNMGYTKDTKGKCVTISQLQNEVFDAATTPTTRMTYRPRVKTYSTKAPAPEKTNATNNTVATTTVSSITVSSATTSVQINPKQNWFDGLLSLIEEWLKI